MILRGNVIWWEDRSCLIHDISQHAVAPICQHDSNEASTTQTPTTTATTTTMFQCPSGWTEFEGHCYLPMPYSKSWSYATSDCAIYGAYLTSIHSRAEDDFVKSWFNDKFWTGATYNISAGTWQWPDGSAWNYENWFDSSYPSSYPCAYNNPVYGWVTTSCTNSYYYICKI
jgi:hypothetical protein